jgi:CheY-like chemotaxis protein
MRRILIVDDETAILGLLSAVFRRAGYEVTTATSGEQALAICQTQAFDAVLSDVSMLGIDGHQTVSRIRARTPEIVAVLMSGLHMECTGACCVPTRHRTGSKSHFCRPLLCQESLAVRNSALIR